MVKRKRAGPALEIASEPAPGRWSRTVVPNDDVATTCRPWPQKMKGDAMLHILQIDPSNPRDTPSPAHTASLNQSIAPICAEILP